MTLQWFVTVDTHASFIFLIVVPDMKLTSSAGSDRAWVWTVQADFADEEPKVEQLAIRFKNAESKAIEFSPPSLSPLFPTLPLPILERHIRT
jgi:hypothetical protein